MITCNIATGEVHIGGVKLDPTASQEVYNHSPDGFAWGYGGSGPSQLALALLLYFAEDAVWAASNYQDLKFDVVAKWARTSIKIPNKVIKSWIVIHGGSVKEGVK